MVIQSLEDQAKIYDRLLICKIRNLFDYYNNKIAKMSQKRNNADGFPAKTKDRLDILVFWVETKEVCTVSWRSSEGGLYQRTSILRDIFQKNEEWIIALESGPLIPVEQLLGAIPGTLPDTPRLEGHPDGP